MYISSKDFMTLFNQIINIKTFDTVIPQSSQIGSLLHVIFVVPAVLGVSCDCVAI